ncbi:DEAD/DEAH box helicase [Sphaerochaeta globosa]|uniref:SNF2-related protein n=1 Tax=Sphaerochaeta globosa (strain ATCC BAA-1886 / DSM 22777 / Buddy) TaxID=158189 RepID=F0RTE5_SPHGB|nr:DEAD/DEAH box helicase [Sphaerochaeta globosa]ADY14427.1 SNF2-related protein [Sphaerochaeta globosa str. Buddy]
MKKPTLSFGIEGTELTIQISPDIREQTIFFRTLQSLIAKSVVYRNNFQSSDNFSVTTNSTDQSKDLLIAIYGLCQRQNIIFEPLTLQTHKLVEQLKSKKNDYDTCREAAILARDNFLGIEYQSFKHSIDRLMTRTLREYQYRAAFFAVKAIMSCNFSVPGSGKTSIAYASFAYLNSLPETESEHVDKVLVIGPISSFQPWKEEFVQCFGSKRELSVVVLDKFTPDQINTYCRSMLTNEITVVNYEKVRRNADSFKIFLERNKTMLVIDEVHRMKNPLSQTSIAIRKFGDIPNAKMLLTGTPMPNGYEDLYTQFSFLWPDHKTIGFTYDQLKNLSKAGQNSLYAKPTIEVLQQNISPYFVRITKQMLQLPPPELPVIKTVRLSETEQKLYDLVNQAKINIDPNDLTSIRLLRAKVIRLMQVTTNPKLLKKPLNRISFELLFNNSVPDDTEESDDKDSFNPMIYDPLVLMASQASKNQISNLIEEIGVSTKLRTVLNLISDLVKQGNKVIVWTIFVQTMQDLRNLIQKELGLSVELLNGQTKNFRAEIIEEFKHSDALPVVIANPSAVSESISLHTCCHHAIYLDMSYNAVHYIQSKDRIHRLGLSPEIKTFYYYIQANNTIDERVYSRVIMKEVRMNQAIENELPPILQQSSITEIIEDLTAKG